MKKLFAILLLAIMVFNFVGYRLLFNWLEKKARVEMAENLDDGKYNRAGLIEIKVALNMPYISNNTAFERVDGSIVLNGATYNYVERKIQNDTLVLHCIPNNNIDKLKLARANYNKSVNDIATPQKGQKNGSGSMQFLLKSLHWGGYRSNSGFACNNTSFIVQRLASKSMAEKIISEKFAESPEQPPDAA